MQEPSFTDLETLATLLQHGDCVVANAGTILLDALVNDRPTVCVLYDEGAPAGESWALKNVSRRALPPAGRVRRLSTGPNGSKTSSPGIERCLAEPGELADERRRVVQAVVGDVDGRAAERVVAAIAGSVGS